MLEGARRFSVALGAAIDGTVRMDVAFDYSDLLRTFLGGAVEIAWLSPIILVKALAKSAHLAAVCEREGQTTYRSALLVRQSSPATTLLELAHARAAWVEPSSAGGHVIPRALLTSAGVPLAAEVFAGSYSQARRLVAANEADFCAVFVHGEAPATPFEGLRILAMSGPIPSEGIVLGAGLTESERVRITNGLHTLHMQHEGELALRTLFQATRLVAPTEVHRAALADLAATLR